MANFESALALTLAHEGGFFHNDKTGEIVNMGVTLSTYRELSDPSATEDTIRNLTHDQVAAFYRENFWNPLHLDEVNDQRLAAKIFDVGVNQGLRMAAKELQEAVNKVQNAENISVDGIFGSRTITVVNSLPGSMLLDAFRRRVELRYRQIAATNPALASNLPGWLARLTT